MPGNKDRGIKGAIDNRIRAQVAPTKEGRVLQVAPGRALVQLVGSATPIPCDFDPQQGVAVGKRVSIQWIANAKKYVITGVYSTISNGTASTDVPPEAFVLAPPSNFAANDDLLGGCLLLTWDVPVSQDVSFEIQVNTSADESGATLVAGGSTRAGMAIVAGEIGVELFCRIRSVSKGYQFSSWSNWLSGFPAEGTTGAGGKIKVVDDHDDIPTPDPGTVTLYYYLPEEILYLKSETGDVASLIDFISGFGDFLADGSVPMTGIFQLNNHAILIDDITTPSNPPSGKFYLYLKSDGQLYTKTSGGVEALVNLASFVALDGSNAMSAGLKTPWVLLNSTFPSVGTVPSNQAALYFGVSSSIGHVFVKLSSGASVALVRADGQDVMTGSLWFQSNMGIVLKESSSPALPTTGSANYLIYLATDGLLHRADSAIDEILNWQIADEVAYTRTTPADWVGTPATVQDAIDELAGRSSGVDTDDQDATEVPYDPTTPADWTEGAPDDVAEALDILVARVSEPPEVDYLQILFMAQVGVTVTQAVTLDYQQVVLTVQVYS